MRTNYFASQVEPFVITKHFVSVRNNLTALERAFELARSGKCRNLIDVNLQLKSEGYSIQQLEGPLLKTQLRHLIEVATKRDKARN
jgi:hypothetical protein